MNNKKAFIVWTSASIVCMLAIFLFSSQPADDSRELSGSLTRIITGIFGTVWSWFVPAGQGIPESFINSIEIVLRKTAHMFIFFILGICTSNAIRQTSIKKWLVFLFSLLLCSFYGAFDEIHQHFVPGRADKWQDWLIDTTGALLGIGVVFLVVWLINKRKQK